MRNIVFKIILLSVLLPSISFSQPYSSNITTNNDFDAPRHAGSLECGSEVNPFTNCGFESGDFTGWVTSDLNAPFVPLQIVAGGLDPGFGFFITAPSEGTNAAYSGFDGDGPGRIEIAQDILVPSTADDLTFDYRGAWELTTFGATIDRNFDVEIQPSGGGAALQTTTILTAPAGNTTLDTGSLSGSIDMSAYANQSVRVAFVLNVPENGTGPAALQLDNIAIQGTLNVDPVASFTYSCNALDCSFDASGSSDSDGSIVDYSWSFGGSGVMANNTFPGTGSFSVTLTVTDNLGGVDTSTQSVGVVANNPPTASFTSSCNFLTCSFDASSSSDSDGTITDYSWSFGGSGVMVNNSFTFSGAQDVTLTVTDNNGATDSTTNTVVLAQVAVPLLSNIGLIIAFSVLLLFGFRQIKRREQV